MERKLQLFFASLLLAVWGVMPVRATLPADSTISSRAAPPPSSAPVAQFATGAAVVAEDEGRAVIPVRVTGEIDGAVDVTVSVSGGTASVGEDVSADAASTTLTFRADTRSVQELVLVVHDDEEDEGVEYLDLTLESSEVAVGSPKRFRLWIRDTALYPDRRADALAERLRDDFEPATLLGAEQAADTLLGVVWNTAGRVRGVFTRAEATISTRRDARAVAREQGVGVDNVWPAALDHDTARRDLHLLMPVQTDVKAARQSQHVLAAVEGEREEDVTPYLRPREDMKGDVARALLYFYVRYPDQADARVLERLKPTLAQWMEEDPVDAAELRRNTLVARYQGNPNPFVVAPELAERTFNLRGSYPVPTVSFVRPTASISESDSVAVVEVAVSGVGSTDVTFDLVLDEAASTAGADDVSGFRRRTVTIPAGTADGTIQRVRIPIAHDEAREETERATFVIENLSGFAEAGEVPQYRLNIEDAAPPSDERGERVTLGSAYPNPLSPGRGSTVRFELSMEEAVPFTVEVFSTLGQRVHAQSYSAGEAERMEAVEVDGSDLPSGLYIVRLRGPSFSTTETFVVVR